MRIRINSLNLIGGERELQLTPGLNVITGPISTGKTTLLRLCRALLGARIEPNRYIREVRENVNFVSGEVRIGASDYTILRPFLSTDTAKIDIASDDRTWRLPYSRPDQGNDQTYLHWLLETLDLPVLRVPTAPTRPDSDTSPLTINDYLMYCTLTQNEIDSSVFGHHDQFRNNKRKFVFEVLYGKYDLEVADLHERLRSVRSNLWLLNAQTSAFDRFLQGTNWENRAALLHDLEAAKVMLQQVNGELQDLSSNAPSSPTIALLRRQTDELDQLLNERQQQATLEQTSITELTQLANQLDAQIGRLTRAVVAQTHLVDFEFVVCPRCGSSIAHDRAVDGTCILCLQQPSSERLDRTLLVKEQNRLGAQMSETEELILMHRTAIDVIEQDLTRLLERRVETGKELDFHLGTFISDEASRLTSAASRRTAAITEVRKLARIIHERSVRIASRRQSG